AFLRSVRRSMRDSLMMTSFRLANGWLECYAAHSSAELNDVRGPPALLGQLAHQPREQRIALRQLANATLRQLHLARLFEQLLLQARLARRLELAGARILRRARRDGGL